MRKELVHAKLLVDESTPEALVIQDDLTKQSLDM